ncbi:hypothetical protein RT99_09500 [Flavobacterium sp. MEB061]|uniref:hypothetical protein n=1 Tax=Flavobacterium sp. MEB061 TaxID=1587524 RepID=UPI0005AC0DB4|nr:hypothetical protein [Flavobacterium sp. MEB061]KIQ22403.1 hypothetical protein RT99_09500 [Flavobacterium sp. MEB061]
MKTKRLLLMATFALLSTILFSCTADDSETADTKTEIKKDAIPVQADAPPDGPGDDTVPVKPPK